MNNIQIDVEVEEFENILSGDQKVIIIPLDYCDLYDFDLDNGTLKVFDRDSPIERNLSCKITHFFELEECYVASIEIISSENV